MRLILNNEHLIGRGSYGKVYKYVHDIQSKPIAVKKVSKSENPDDVYNEAEIHSMLCGNSNIVNLLKVIDNNEYVYFFMELMDQPLSKLIFNTNIALSGVEKLLIASGIAEGLAFLHERRIIHRDIKPENILLDQNKRPKIADFGLSWLQDTPLKHRHSFTSGYSPYEALIANITRDHYYIPTVKHDI
jgi:serine/threonine protein kinase